MRPSACKEECNPGNARKSGHAIRDKDVKFLNAGQKFALRVRPSFPMTSCLRITVEVRWFGRADCNLHAVEHVQHAITMYTNSRTTRSLVTLDGVLSIKHHRNLVFVLNATKPPGSISIFPQCPVTDDDYVGSNARVVIWMNAATGGRESKNLKVLVSHGPFQDRIRVDDPLEKDLVGCRTGKEAICVWQVGFQYADRRVDLHAVDDHAVLRPQPPPA